MKKTFCLITALLLLATLLCACGSSKEDIYDSEAPKSGYSSAEYAEYVDEEGVDPESPLDPDEAIDRQIIKTYRTTLETKDFSAAAKRISEKAREFGGYVATSSENYSGEKYIESSATYTVRVPADKAEAYLAAISENCNVLRSTLDTEDVTASYYDLKSTLESLVKEEEKIESLLESATNLNTILDLEDKLAQIRQKINSVNYQLKLLEKSVNYSYIYLTLNEVKEYTPDDEKEPSFGRQILDAFSDSLEVFVKVAKFFLLAFIWMLPFNVTAGAVFCAVFFPVRAIKKKKNNK